MTERNGQLRVLTVCRMTVPLWKDCVLAASAALGVWLLDLLNQFQQAPRPNMQHVANGSFGARAEDIQNISSVLDEWRQDATRQRSLVQLGLGGEGRLVEPQEASRV